MVAAEGALTAIEESGTAVGFSEAKEKEGVGPVGVGNRVPERVTLEPAVAAAEEPTEEAAEDAAAATTVLVLPLADATEGAI